MTRRKPNKGYPVAFVKILIKLCFSNTELVKNPQEEDPVWDYYEEGTLSIELLKDDELHKIYFRVKDKVNTIKM